MLIKSILSSSQMSKVDNWMMSTDKVMDFIFFHLFCQHHFYFFPASVTYVLRQQSLSISPSFASKASNCISFTSIAFTSFAIIPRLLLLRAQLLLFFFFSHIPTWLLFPFYIQHNFDHFLDSLASTSSLCASILSSAYFAIISSSTSFTSVASFDSPRPFFCYHLRSMTTSFTCISYTSSYFSLHNLL